MKQQQPQQNHQEPTARAPAASQQDTIEPPPSPKPAAPSSNFPDANQQPMLPSRIKALRSFQLEQAGNSPNRGSSIASPTEAEKAEAGSPLTRRRLRRGGGAETVSSPSPAP